MTKHRILFLMTVACTTIALFTIFTVKAATKTAEGLTNEKPSTVSNVVSTQLQQPSQTTADFVQSPQYQLMSIIIVALIIAFIVALVYLVHLHRRVDSLHKIVSKA